MHHARSQIADAQNHKRSQEADDAQADDAQADDAETHKRSQEDRT
jgi:hypothetical protein